MMITICVYDIETGKILYIDKGHPEAVTNEMPTGADFTLLEPPDYVKEWLWVDSEWVELLPINNPDIHYDDMSIWSADLGQWVNDATLLEEKKLSNQLDVWELIKNKRLQQVTGGVLVNSVDKVFHTDETTAIQYSSVAGMIALNNYEPIMWKVLDNTWVSLTEDLFRELQVAMRVNTQQTYMVAEQHKAAMLEAEDPLAYDYSTGWLNGVTNY